MKKVLLLGATGVLGTYITPLAQRLWDSIDLICASRSIPLSPNGKTRRVNLKNATDIRKALADIDLVINAVGPFEYDPTPLIQACLEHGCHYLDIAEVPQFMTKIQALVQKEPYPKSYFITGCSTVPGLIQTLVKPWASDRDIQSIRVYLSLGSRKPVSTTLLYCLLRPLGQRSPTQEKYYDRLTQKNFAEISPRFFGRYPASFEETGLELETKKVPALFYVGMDTWFHGKALQWGGFFLPYFSNQALLAICSVIQWWTPIITRLGKDLGLLLLEGYNSRGEVIHRLEIRAPQQGLNIPALPVVWATKRLLQENFSALPFGILGMEHLFTPQEIIQGLQSEGFQVHDIFESRRMD